jgi:hypothetical protein
VEWAGHKHYTHKTVCMMPAKLRPPACARPHNATHAHLFVAVQTRSPGRCPPLGAAPRRLRRCWASATTAWPAVSRRRGARLARRSRAASTYAYTTQQSMAASPRACWLRCKPTAGARAPASRARPARDGTLLLHASSPPPLWTGPSSRVADLGGAQTELPRVTTVRALCWFEQTRPPRTCCIRYPLANSAGFSWRVW